MDGWSAGLQEEISAITGDDAAMAVLGVGADFKEFKDLFAPRLDELAQDVIAPLDELRNAITRAEQELEALRSRQVSEMGAMWDRYKDGYERYLHPEPVLDEEEAPAEEAPEDAEAPKESDVPAESNEPADDTASDPDLEAEPRDLSTEESSS